MRSYDEYLKQNPDETTLFKHARDGNLEALKHAKDENPSLDLNLKDHKGYSALMYAAYFNHLDMVKWLIAQNVDVNSFDKGGNSVLMGVAFKGYSDVAQTLIKAGADTEATNFAGMTALQFAQMFGRSEVIELLSATKPNFFKRKTQQLLTWGFYLKQKIAN